MSRHLMPRSCELQRQDSPNRVGDLRAVPKVRMGVFTASLVRGLASPSGSILT